MRVTIIQRPGPTLTDVLFTRWRVGETYDVSLQLASLLMIEGCAHLEMRGGTDRRHDKRWGHPERRRHTVGAGRS